MGYLIEPKWVPTEITHSPVLTDQYTYSSDRGRHLMRVATGLNRNAIFKDLFEKIEERAAGE